MKITLTAGRAHQKHTEGGDFRQATYRAVRQGLRTAQSVLLEPVYEYQLEVPSFAAGRALADLQRMQASFPAPETDGDMCLIKGDCAGGVHAGVSVGGAVLYKGQRTVCPVCCQATRLS